MAKTGALFTRFAVRDPQTTAIVNGDEIATPIVATNSHVQLVTLTDGFTELDVPYGSSWMFIEFRAGSFTYTIKGADDDTGVQLSGSALPPLPVSMPVSSASVGLACTGAGSARVTFIVGSFPIERELPLERPSVPETVFFRQYANRMEPALAALEADPVAFKARYPGVGFCVLTQDPTSGAEVTAMATILARLYAQDTPAHPGFRLNPSGGTVDYWDAALWARHATGFTNLWGARADQTDTRFAFDVEVYGVPDVGQPTPDRLVTLNKTRAELLEVMQPLLTAIAAAGVSPAEPVLLSVHPTIVDSSGPDQVMDILFDAMDGVGELWTEEGFGAVEDTRRTGDEGAAFARLGSTNLIRELEFAYPRCKVRVGLDDSYFRRWKGPIGDPVGEKTEAGKLFGPGLWLFDHTRRDAGSGTNVFMSTDWYNGYPTLNSLNDVAAVFEAGELNLAGSISAQPPGNTSPGPFTLHGWVDDILNDSGQAGWYATRQGVLFPGAIGQITSGTVGLRESVAVLPIDGTPTWTLRIKFMLPVGTLGDRYPICCAAQSNAKSFELFYKESTDQVILQVKTGSFTKTDLVALASPTRGATTTIFIGRNGTEWRHGTSRTAGVGNGESIGYLHIGLGWSDFDAGAGVRTQAGGLCWVDDLPIWYRFLSDADCTAAALDGGRYPWGYGQ